LRLTASLKRFVGTSYMMAKSESRITRLDLNDMIRSAIDSMGSTSKLSTKLSVDEVVDLLVKLCPILCFKLAAFEEGVEKLDGSKTFEIFLTLSEHCNNLLGLGRKVIALKKLQICAVTLIEHSTYSPSKLGLAIFGRQSVATELRRVDRLLMCRF
jgi:hypothetical protein